VWNNRGLIFDLGSPELSSNMLAYAQGPQALLLADRTRVFFSTRKLDIHGKYLSGVRYVDFSPDFSELLDVSKQEAVTPGALGSFDEHGIFPLNVVKIGDTVRGYSSGWSRRVSVDITMSIGILSSGDNGKSFERWGSGPAIGPSPEEPFLVGDPFVYFDGKRFHLWYIYGTKWTRDPTGRPERTYRIGHRKSNDGLDWDSSKITHGLVAALSPSEAQAMPSVLALNGNAYMVFCYRDTFGFREGGPAAYRLGIAVSEDLENWTRKSEFCEWRTNDWDSQMMCYPNIHQRDGMIYLLYNGNTFGQQGFGLAEISQADFINSYG